MPFSGEISGRTAVIIPTPMNDTDAIASSATAAGVVRVRHVDADERDDGEEDRGRADEAVEDRVHAHADQVHRP